MTDIRHVDFIPDKYGHELWLDAKRVDAWNGVAAQPHRLDYHEVLIVERGGGVLHVDGRVVPLRPASVVVTAPGQVRRIALREPTDVRMVVFAPRALERLPSLMPLVPGRPEPRPAVDAGTVHRVTAIADTIAQEVSSGARHQAAMLDALLAQLVILLARGGVAARPKPPVLTRLDALVEARFREEHSASAYADLLGVSLDHLSALVRQHGEGSVKAVLNRRIQREAMRLLLYTDWDVTAVALALGYDDPPHFARAFRRFAGVSPSEFRRVNASGR